MYLSHNAVGTTELHMQPFYQTVSQLWCRPFEGCRGQDYIQPHMQKVVYSSWELTWKWVAFPLHWRERNGSTLVPILNMSSRIDSKMFLIWKQLITTIQLCVSWNIAHQWTFRITPKGYDSEITCDKMTVNKIKKLLPGCDFFRLNQVPRFQELSVLMLQVTGTIHTWLMRHEKGYCCRKGPFLFTTI